MYALPLNGRSLFVPLSLLNESGDNVDAEAMWDTGATATIINWDAAIGLGYADKLIKQSKVSLGKVAGGGNLLGYRVVLPKLKVVTADRELCFFEIENIAIGIMPEKGQRCLLGTDITSLFTSAWFYSAGNVLACLRPDIIKELERRRQNPLNGHEWSRFNIKALYSD